jgi:SAM-dependent methyltransferase
MLGDDLRAELGAALPDDDARQSFAHDVLRQQLRGLASAAPRVVDLGCGRGEGVDVVRGVVAAADWVGVDIAQSAEVDERRRSDATFLTFDGVHLPLDDASVDLVFTQQVFEHVQQPDPLLADVARVLRRGGTFCGSLSQLEAFHSRSVGGFTPYGWRCALERAGMQLVAVRPGIDVGTLLLRRVAGRSGRFDRYWVQESPGNRLLRCVARAKRVDAAGENALKLLFAGQFTFVAQRR